MSISLMRSECRKFAPNIFNKSKCTNCFRQKEEHSAEALESNRATRKIAKCGYLFVAPGWDFTNPLNRTKRWQRRWFVLYDDGELSYSVDEHPETVPQASIDMNKVLEVSDAEAVTGNSFSLAITGPDAVTFVKGTCREECRWWGDVLSVFPRSKGRHKRTVTLPGGQSQSQQPATRSNSTPLRVSNSVSDVRSRYGWDSESPLPLSPLRSSQDANQDDDEEDDVFPTRDVVDSPLPSLTSLSSMSSAVETRKVYRDQPASSGSPPTRDKSRTRRVQNREKRGLKSGRSFSEDFASILPSWRESKLSADSRDEKEEAARRVLFHEFANECKRDEKLKDIAASLTRPRNTRSSPSPVPERVQPTRDGDSGGKQVRGDPDGCGLDVSTQRYSPSAELRVDLPAEDLLNIKKGWLMKQGASKEWNKHWFVLRGAALMYYRDPTSEDKGLLDGVIDLSSISNVTEVQVARNYGFQMTSWDDRRYVLSAVTAGIRANWMAAVQRAAGLAQDLPLALGEKLERELELEHRSLVCAERERERERDATTPAQTQAPPPTTSDWGETVALSLPPSPPLNRTPISRVKERARSRVCKRSRSSPPSSRRSTLDSVRPEDLVLACCGEMPESDVDERIPVEPPPSERLVSQRELEDMKSQLKMALCEMSSAEKEVLRLRQREVESGALERQVKELLATLERTEEQLKQRTREVVELESLKEQYTALLREHEALLDQQDWRTLYQQLQERYHHDKEVWDQQLSHAEADLHETAERCEALSRELESSKSTSEELRQRLATGLEENENLYARLHELEGRNTALALSASASRERGRSMDSLSDLTNIDLDLHFDELDKDRVVEEFEELRGRFEKAVAEIRAMKRELRESHALYDELELVTLALRQDAKRCEEADRAQASLMAARIEDLTLKLSAAEKQVRQLKQKLSKSESREKRRSLSLKGRESFQICRELEDKLGELEGKLAALEAGPHPAAAPSSPSTPSSPSPTPSLTGSTKSPRERRRDSSVDGNGKKDAGKVSSRLRRKSLDSATSSEPMKVLIRLSALESKVAKAMADRSATSPVVKKEGEASPTPQPQQVRVSVERVSEELDGYGYACDADTQARLLRLEDVILKSRTKLRECLLLLDKSNPKQQQPQLVFANLERSLNELDAVLQSCSQDVSGEVKSVVSRLERLLQTKLKELGRQRQALRLAGKLDRQARLALVAEKLAYETVLVGRIQQTWLADSALAERQVVAEVREINRLMSGLSAKLNPDKAGVQDQGVETSLDHLTRVMSRFLTLQGRLASALSKSAGPKRLTRWLLSPDAMEDLLKRKQQLDTAVASFRREKLRPLARLLAAETLNVDWEEERHSGSRTLNSEDRRIREAWKMAQEAVNHELVQAEISHVTMRCAQAYEGMLAQEKDADLVVSAAERVGLELWADLADESLRNEMEVGMSDLTSFYEECLSEMKHRKEAQKDGDREAVTGSLVGEEEVRRLLTEFADITAHKVLVDSRIAVLKGEVAQNVDSADVREENAVNIGSLLDTEAELSSFLADNADVSSSAEFEYLFQKFCGECRLALGDGIREIPEEESCSGEVMWALSDIKEELNRLQDCIQLGCEDGPKSSERTDRSIDGSWSWTDVCAQCTELRKQVVSLQECVLQSQSCSRCQQLQDQLQRLESQHDEDLRLLRQSQEKEMATLTGELEMQRRSLVCQHEMEQAQLKERARKLERRLDTLDSEYSLQMDNLHSAYQKTLAAGLERDLDSGDNIRQRYQTEIEHLRALCEKGLVAMDNSHRRIIAELEEKHRQEAEQLRLEKEQALAEETQATLAALDAMRKAHEMEVQKEIAKFKAEFIKKMQATHDIGALHKEHEAEMEEIKQEILSLSEKYSVKCLESAALEEQLGLVSKQLAQAQQHILDLDARNKQLRAHLVSEASESGSSSPSLQLLRESKLSASSSRGSSTVSVSSGSSVDSTHGSMGSVDCWSQQTPPQTSGPPDPWGLRLKGSKRNSSTNGIRTECEATLSRSKSKQRTEPAVLSTAELMRCPRRHCSSLPPLGSPMRSSSPSLSISSLSSHSSSPCPLSGMVAERKKLFEQ